MIYKSRSPYARQPGGYLRFRNSDQGTIHGFGEGEYIRLRDEYGRVWVGSATLDDHSNMVRYRFHNEYGGSIAGISDSHGILLRDDKGKTWRGFID